MSTTITRALADTYFSTRLDKDLWDGFEVQLRDRAIVSAIDVLTRANGSDITSETTDSYSSYYPDRAVYHQALHMLRNSDAIANAENSAPHWAGVSQTGEAKEQKMVLIPAEVKRWLNWQNGSSVNIGRG